MDGQFWTTLLKILVFFPLVLALILILGKLGNKFNLTSNNKYMKILERLPLSKDTSLLIVKVGDKGYLMSSSSGKSEILKELSASELENINVITNSNTMQLNKATENFDFSALNISKLYSKYIGRKSDSN
jgi:flagellar protein FliO/FliZ